MPLDKKKLKEKLESERDILLGELSDIGRLNPETNEWEAVPETQDFPEADPNNAADRFEDFESRSSMLKDLELRLNNILSALKKMDRVSFGKCEICKKEIEVSRMEANPAARTCKEHINEEV
jgi:RNA polymerase-binding transcription factor DksA